MTGVWEGAMDSVRRAWAAVAESVVARMPERLPHFTLPALPFTLPSLPSFSAPPLGKVMSSLGTMMLGPAQMHGLAAYYHLATGEIAPPSAGPAVEFADGCARSATPAATTGWAASGEWNMPAAACGVAWAAPEPAVDPLRLACALTVVPGRRDLPCEVPEGVADHLRVGHVADAWQQELERGQRPPPVAVA